jgi:membrane protease YdiL (CAAX protease family)
MQPRSDRARFSLRHAFGLVRPAPGWRRWLSDAHVRVALLAAIPVWLALGLIAGNGLRAVEGWLASIAFLMVQPILEELAFRGALQGALLRWTSARKLGPVTVANVWTTICFAVLHLTSQPPAWALAVAVPSLVFGHLRDRFGSVLPAVALHVVYNAGFALTSWWVHR